MNTYKTTTDITATNINSEASAIYSKSMEHSYPNWDVSEREGDIRMTRYFNFLDESQVTSFEKNVGKMMYAGSIFVLAQKLPSRPCMRVLLRIKPTEASVVAASEIISYIEEHYGDTTAGGTPIAA